MGAFALGTVPLMLLLGVFAVSLGRRFLRAVSSAGAAIVCVLGLSMISQGSGLTGMIDERQIMLWAAVISAVILAAALPAASRPVRAILAAVCLALGVWSITGKRGEPDREQFFSVVEGSVQTVTTQLRPGSFPTLTVRAGIPVRWIITVDERNTNGCNYQAVLPEFGIKHTFVPGENVIEFLPQVPGEFPYSCWMGMIRGAIVVLSAPHK